MGEMNNNPDIIRSLLNADEDMYPKFTEAQKLQELEYIKSHISHLKEKTLDALTDPQRTSEAQRYFDQTEFWSYKLDEFYKRYPDLQHST
ncbi:hypothetical protein IPM19_03405 [bacterium]|nr:MAG: hypothetical protein IPM19_03405 [bacterium]